MYAISLSAILILILTRRSVQYHMVSRGYGRGHGPSARRPFQLVPAAAAAVMADRRGEAHPRGPYRIAREKRAVAWSLPAARINIPEPRDARALTKTTKRTNRVLGSSSRSGGSGSALLPSGHRGRAARLRSARLAELVRFCATAPFSPSRCRARFGKVSASGRGTGLSFSGRRAGARSPARLPRG